MRPNRLRVELCSPSGALGDVAVALGRIGVDIRDVQVRDRWVGWRVEELIVDLHLPLDLPAVEYAARQGGAVVTSIVTLDGHSH